MKDPVICPDGYSYEREAIVLHLRSSPFSPMTRQAVNERDLIPNRALKDSIKAWLAENPDHECVLRESFAAASIVEHSESFSVTLQLRDEACQKEYSQDVLCMIVDVSGSMSSAPVLKDLSGSAIQDANLSKLEMVRHAVKVAVTSLPLGTHIGVVTYDHDVSQLVPFTQISKESDRDRIIKEVSKMNTHGCTDIYKALDFSAQATIKYCEATKSIANNARKKMWLLTDGLPYNPNMPVKKGDEIIEGFEFLTSTNKMVKELQISTFGFGSGQQIETNVLEKLARITGGSFGYIPDPSMLACNINGRNANDFMSISNETIEVTFPKEYTMECVGGTVLKEFTTESSRVARVRLRGAFKKGIPRHLYVTLSKRASRQAGASSNEPSLICETDKTRLTSHVEKVASLDSLKQSFEVADNEVDLVLPLLFAFVRALSLKNEVLIGNVIDFVNEIRSKPGADSRNDYQYLLGIMHDAKEGKKACEQQFWDNWGKHYLRALLSAYECEESLSSRDLGTIALFVNKSDDMKNVVKDMEAKFKSLPIQSCRKISQSTVARYADAGSTVCFTPLTPIKMADGSFLPIGSLRAGMEVMTQPIKSTGLQCSMSSATIITVVETEINGHQEVVNICENAFATPYHPVKTTVGNGPLGWVFPKDLQQQGMHRQCTPPAFTSVFNLVLNKDHVIFVGDGSAQTVTLGHGYKYGVLDHKFFGTSDCLDHLYEVALGKGKTAPAPPYVRIQQGSLIREVTIDDPDGQIVGVLSKEGQIGSFL